MKSSHRINLEKLSKSYQALTEHFGNLECSYHLLFIPKLQKAYEMLYPDSMSP